MRRLALLLAGGALWLVFMAIPAFADGGPHVVPTNSGTGGAGLAGDCAACHRAHRGQAADLLKATLPGLCLDCHNGTGATVNVVDGIQYVPTGTNPAAGEHAGDVVLGALRGGGFEFALIDPGSSGPSRLSYASRGGIILSFGTSDPGSARVEMDWPAIASYDGVANLIFYSDDSVATIQGAADSRFGTSTAYSSSTASGNMSGLPAGNRNVIVTKDWPVTSTTSAYYGQYIITFALHNAFRLAPVPDMPTLTDAPAGASVTDGRSIGNVGHVNALTSGQPVTSTHMGEGTVWGNGPQGQGNPGATGVELTCTNCHNPHGNGQYRILNTKPGEDWANDSIIADWSAPINEVYVADVGVTSSTKNYTIKPARTGSPGAYVVSYQAGDVIGGSYEGDYWRYKYDPSGAANFTNFYLKSDPMSSGWVGTGPTAYSSLTNATGAMTAWCVQCHTRYNGHSAQGTSSLNAQTPIDNIFMYKHGTTRIGCEQCHVNHGSNVAMNGPAADVDWPDGTPNEDSALLKVNNRGTCQLCHDPTGTAKAGTWAAGTGYQPAGITPGP